MCAGSGVRRRLGPGATATHDDRHGDDDEHGRAADASHERPDRRLRLLGRRRGLAGVVLRVLSDRGLRLVGAVGQNVLPHVPVHRPCAAGPHPGVVRREDPPLGRRVPVGNLAAVARPRRPALCLDLEPDLLLDGPPFQTSVTLTRMRPSRASTIRPAYTCSAPGITFEGPTHDSPAAGGATVTGTATKVVRAAVASRRGTVMGMGRGPREGGSGHLGLGMSTRYRRHVRMLLVTDG